MKFSVDILDFFGAGGWALSPRGRVVVEVFCGDACLARVIPDRLRTDVAALFADIPGIEVCGFRAAYALGGDVDEVELIVVGTEIDGEGRPCGMRQEMARKTVRNPARVAQAFAQAEASEGGVGPFPRGIEAAVRSLWPDAPPARDEAAQRAIVARLKSLAPQLSGASAPTKPLINYFRFLRTTWAHFKFVDRYFPTVNPGKSVTDTDWRSRPNSPTELFSIAHHLYVLKSYGVSGEFAEFGCFKGFSSSMLSYACGVLGIRMHVFDSFAGLPASDSKHYREGEFRGSLEEVTSNVQTFGARGVVEFHPGFFSESVPRRLPALNKLMAIWMDVDLYQSAVDVMPVVAKIDPRGAIFSHECVSGHFDGGGIAAHAPSAENVPAAIIDRYRAMDVALTGRYIAGSTGSFWSRRTGIPVLANDCLIELVNAV